MTTHDSDIELAGKLAASLTPRVPRITAAHRGEQSSGLFDIGALYAASVEQVMRRARTAREQPPVLGVVGVARPFPGSPIRPWAPAPARELVASVIDPEPEPVVRARGVGWFGVAIAWLATAAIGAAAATMVPAHSVTIFRGHAPLPVAPAIVPVATPAAPVPAVAVTPAPSPVASQPAALAPVATPGDVRPRKASGAAHLHIRRAVPRAAPAEAAAPATEPKAAPTAAEAPPARVEAPSPAPAAGGSSLEDLMRRAVEADAKRR